MMDARRAALEALLDITDKGAYANLRVKKGLQEMDSADARWVSALVYTTLDHLLRIDHVLAGFAKGRVQPVIRGILRLGAAQILYMDVPDSAACNESVALAKRVGKGQLAGYVNGVLRQLCRNKDALPPLPQDPVERISISYSWPKWLVQEYVQCYGLEFTQALLSAKAPGMTLRAQWPFTASELAQALTDRGISFRRGELDANAFHLMKGLDIAADPLFQSGKITVQSESAMLVCRLLHPSPGMKILDACAAPGGKTAYLSHLMEGRGHIDAWEIHSHRAELLQKTLERLHVKNASVFCRDAACPDGALEAQYDAVLLDVPCSGLGVFGKPDARYAKSDAIIQELAQLQANILNACAPYVRPGGVLIYATCTISRRENEGQIQAFLQAHPEFRPDVPAGLPPKIAARFQAGMVQLFPHLDQGEGFFMARLVKADG